MLQSYIYLLRHSIGLDSEETVIRLQRIRSHRVVEQIFLCPSQFLTYQDIIESGQLGQDLPSTCAEHM